MSDKFTESEATDMVTSSGGATDSGLYIEVVRGSLGLKRLAALDFLVYHCKRMVTWVNEAKKKKGKRHVKKTLE
jgi:hypothetical protein